MARPSSADLPDGRTLRQTEEELALVRQLADITRRLVGEIEPTEAMRQVAEAGVALLGADAAVIALTEEGISTARSVSVGVDPDLHQRPIVPGEGLHGQVLASGEAVVVADYDTWDGAVPEFVGIGLHAAVGVPIATDHQTVGVLSVHHRDPNAVIGQHEVNVLTLLAEHAASALLRAKAHRMTSEEQGRFAAILDTLPDGLAVIEDGNVTAWNAGAVRLTGLSAAAVVGSPPPFDFTEAVGRLELSTKAGPRWVEAVSNPMSNGTDMVWLLRDVTEQERLEQARNLFLATTSHELKTPLTVVKGLAITLRRNWDRMTEEQREESLETIERRTIHLDRLVERVLVGSRVEAGVMDFHLTPVELRASVGDVIEGFAAVAPLHHLVDEFPPDLPSVAADRQALDTIMGHIVDNAIKYAPSGGTVSISGTRDGDRVRVSVSDQGVGIDGELADLLRPFTRGERHTTRRIAGIGIGLYVVSRLLEGMGGQLSAVNRPEGGSTFSFTLPIWGTQASE
ncbi:MAG: ATP-binding protein [Acidimicrobiales bacterium]